MDDGSDNSAEPLRPAGPNADAAPPGPLDAPAASPDLLKLVENLRVQLGEIDAQRRRILEDYQHLEEQIRLAVQVQRELLPQPPDFAGLEIDTLYRPAAAVSGDMYNITRLDETHLGISLADASGHGMPAALLTVLLKRSFRGKEIRKGAYRLLRPTEVLRRVNRDVLDTDFKQCQFVTGLYAVYEQVQRTLSFARGGLPYPIFLRPGRPPRQLIGPGPLIGAFDEAEFKNRTIRLRPGDAVLFYSDGLEALLLDRGGPAPFDCITHTPWFAALPTRPLPDSIAEIDRRLSDPAPRSSPPDDVTIVALRVLP